MTTKMAKNRPKATETDPFLPENGPKTALKGFLDLEWEPKCTLCGANQGLERHHKVFRSRGGGEGENLVWLCRVCHGAAHGLRVVHDGHCCETCRVLRSRGCFFGERATGRPVVSEIPWEER